MWDMLNVTTGSNWTALNSLIQDDQVDNGRAQPDSIVNCPVFTAKCLDDDFLLAQIGVLDELCAAYSPSPFVSRLTPALLTPAPTTRTLPPRFRSAGSSAARLYTS